MQYTKPLQCGVTSEMMSQSFCTTRGSLPSTHTAISAEVGGKCTDANNKGVINYKGLVHRD